MKITCHHLESRFHLYGYAVNEYANPYPTYTNSRYAFDYLQCEPVFNEDVLDVIPANFLDEIAEKLRAGVTIFHGDYVYYSDHHKLLKTVENLENSVIAAITPAQ